MMRVAILLCTHRKAALAQTIASLADQAVRGAELRLIVADNDETEAARPAILRAGDALPFALDYIHAPAGNIAIARNACLDAAGDADWIATIGAGHIAPRGWLAGMLGAAGIGAADCVFGPVRALYPPQAPRWMRELQPHSLPYDKRTRPPCGCAGNALLRWRGRPWQGRRFDPALGRMGGEDADFFRSISGIGARMTVARGAEVADPVSPHRLRPEWLAERSYRAGQARVLEAQRGLSRAGLLGWAALRAGGCAAMQAIGSQDESRRNFWFLQGQIYRGICAELLGRPHPAPDRETGQG